jgi:hypothetical protein
MKSGMNGIFVCVRFKGDPRTAQGKLRYRAFEMEVRELTFRARTCHGTVSPDVALIPSHLLQQVNVGHKGEWKEYEGKSVLQEVLRKWRCAAAKNDYYHERQIDTADTSDFIGLPMWTVGGGR